MLISIEVFNCDYEKNDCKDSHHENNNTWVHFVFPRPLDTCQDFVLHLYQNRKMTTSTIINHQQLINKWLKMVCQIVSYLLDFLRKEERKANKGKTHRKISWYSKDFLVLPLFTLISENDKKKESPQLLEWAFRRCESEDRPSENVELSISNLPDPFLQNTLFLTTFHLRVWQN